MTSNHHLDNVPDAAGVDKPVAPAVPPGLAMRPLGAYPPPLNPMLSQDPAHKVHTDPFIDPSNPYMDASTPFVDVAIEQSLSFEEFLKYGDRLPQMMQVEGASFPVTMDNPSTSNNPSSNHTKLTLQEQKDVDMTVDGLTEEDLAFGLSDDETTPATATATAPVPAPTQSARPLRKVTLAELRAGGFVFPGGSRDPPSAPSGTRQRESEAVPAPETFAGNDTSRPASPTPSVAPSTFTTADDDDFATGRLNAAEEEMLSQAANSIYAQIHELAYELRRKPDLIINRINQLTGSKVATKITLWNYYQSYFSRNKEAEHARLGTQEPTKPTKHHLNAFIRDFTDEFGPKWPEFLILQYEMHHVEDVGTVGEAERSFRNLTSHIASLLDDYEKRNHIQAMVVMCGGSVNQDQANGRVHATGALKDFVEKRLLMSDQELLAHAKAHSYDAFSMIHAKQAAAKRDNAHKPTTDDPEDTVTPALKTTVGLRPTRFLALLDADTSGIPDANIRACLAMSPADVKKADRELCRKYVKECFQWHLHFMQVATKERRMPFQDTPQHFSALGLAVRGWPTHLPYPFESHAAAIIKYNVGTKKRNDHAGLRAYELPELRAMLTGFLNGTLGLVRHSAEDLQAGLVPVFEDHVPDDEDPVDVEPRRLFANNRIEIFKAKDDPPSTADGPSKAPATRARVKKAQALSAKDAPPPTATNVKSTKAKGVKAKGGKAKKEKEVPVEPLSDDDDMFDPDSPVPAKSAKDVKEKGKKQVVAEDSDGDMYLSDLPPTNEQEEDQLLPSSPSPQRKPIGRVELTPIKVMPKRAAKKTTRTSAPATSTSTAATSALVPAAATSTSAVATASAASDTSTATSTVATAPVAEASLALKRKSNAVPGEASDSQETMYRRANGAFARREARAGSKAPSAFGVPRAPVVPAPPVQQAPIVPAPPVQQAPIVPAPPVQQAPIVPAPPVQQAPIVPVPPVQQAPIVPVPPVQQAPTATTSGAAESVQVDRHAWEQYMAYLAARRGEGSGIDGNFVNRRHGA